MKDVRAVIFDMDGLMLDTEPVHRDTWQRAAAEHGFQITNELYLECVGRTDADGAAVLVRVLGDAFPLAQFRARRAEFLQQHVATKSIELKPGLLELLEWLEQRNVTRGVATSTHRAKALHLLDRFRLAPRFGVVVGGDQVRHGKPEPDIYLAAAAALGVAPAQCLVLEDSEPGVRAAHAAGMRAVMVPDLKPPSPAVAALAHRVVASLHDVLPVLAEVV